MNINRSNVCKTGQTEWINVSVLYFFILFFAGDNGDDDDDDDEVAMYERVVC